MVDGPQVLVVGASGYIGGRLVDKLVAEGIRPVVVGRDPAALTGRWPGLVARRLDLDRPDSIEPALAGIEVAFYLVRLWDGTRRGTRRDASRMEAFSAAAGRAGVRRVIHLTSLWDPFSACDLPEPDSPRNAEDGPAPAVTELRAGLIIGSGSSNFEILRYLVERQPVLLLPRWARTRCEPVSTGDISPALVAALRHPEVTGRVEIGCGEVVDFADLCRRYSRARGLRRPMVRLPVWGKRASALWIHLLSPVPATLALPFVRSLGRASTVQDPQPAARLGIVTRRVDEMLRRAIERRDTATTTWFDAVRRPRAPLSDQNDIEGMYRDQREQVVDAPPKAVFDTVTRIGGAAGWPSAEFLWDVRGVMDRAVGGPGMRRGRRDPVDLRVGDVVDFWRVEACESPEILRLCAEMKLPGLAWLQFEMTPVEGGRTRFVQTAYFEPRGVFGFLYWWSVLPFHVFVFGSMLKELARRAELLARTTPGAADEPAAPELAPPA